MTDHPTTIQLIGGPTALLTYGGLRILTDPTFDPPGDHARPGTQVVLRKLTGPALAPPTSSRSTSSCSPTTTTRTTSTLPAARSCRAPRACSRRRPGPSGWRERRRPRAGPDSRAERPGRRAGARHGCRRGAWLTRGRGEERPGDRLRPARRGPAHDLRQRRQTRRSRSPPRSAASTARSTRRCCSRAAPAYPCCGATPCSPSTPSGRPRRALLDPAVIVPIHQEGWEHFTSPPEELRRAFGAAGLDERLRSIEPGAQIEL